MQNKELGRWHVNEVNVSVHSFVMPRSAGCGETGNQRIFLMNGRDWVAPARLREISSPEGLKRPHLFN